MIDEFKRSTVSQRIIEFILIGSIFYLSSYIVPTSSQSNILIYAIIYSGVIFFSVHLGKRMVSLAFSSVNPVAQLMLRNATGLVIGTCLMLIPGVVVSAASEMTITVILSSIFTFFVLGTLSPLVFGKRNGPSLQRS